MGLGKGTNNFAELLALKLLLRFALEKNSRNIHIFGDSMVVINWVNKIQRCRIKNLNPFFEEVCKLMGNFDTITCPLVYMEINSEADKFSKEGLWNKVPGRYHSLKQENSMNFIIELS